MQHIYVNFKRFDVPAQMGGVNRISDIADYSATIIPLCAPKLEKYRSSCEFVQFYPESQIPAAVKAAREAYDALAEAGLRINPAMYSKLIALENNIDITS